MERRKKRWVRIGRGRRREGENHRQRNFSGA